MKVAVVGATGMVGEIMRSVLEERNFPITEFLPVASARSVGKTISFQGKDYTVIGLEEAVEHAPDFALFSAGGQTSLDWAPKFAAMGTTVIDNSSAWRMHPDHKLIVPEINADQLTPDDKIIANPNCSTIQMVMALAPLHKRYGIERVVVSTYQSITGTGVKAVQQLEDEEGRQHATIKFGAAFVAAGLGLGRDGAPILGWLRPTVFYIIMFDALLDDRAVPFAQLLGPVKTAREPLH